MDNLDRANHFFVYFTLQKLYLPKFINTNTLFKDTVFFYDLKKKELKLWKYRYNDKKQASSKIDYISL